MCCNLSSFRNPPLLSPLSRDSLIMRRIASYWQTINKYITKPGLIPYSSFSYCESSHRGSIPDSQLPKSYLRSSAHSFHTTVAPSVPPY